MESSSILVDLCRRCWRCVYVCLCTPTCIHTQGGRVRLHVGFQEETSGDTYFRLSMLPSMWTPPPEHSSWTLATTLFISPRGRGMTYLICESRRGNWEDESVILWRGSFLLLPCAVNFTEPGFCWEHTPCNLPGKSLRSTFSTEGEIKKLLG